jgi:1,2-diacylglycerol 3-beta-glucosyltransferase
MQENSWLENNSSSEFEPLDSLLHDLGESPESENFRHQLDRGQSGRRQKAALTLALVWGGTFALHWFWFGLWIVWGVTLLIGVQALRLLLAKSPTPLPIPPKTAAQLADQCSIPDQAEYPFLSLLVAAKNEAAVVNRLVQTLCNLDYPTHRYEVWIVDDNSTDDTLAVLTKLSQTYRQLRVLSRLPGAGGGKSGALNQVLPLTRGEFIAVFDADAQVPRDMLRRVLAQFERQRVGAVQVRKTIANAKTNLWTQGQHCEMALDAFFQQQRQAIGGIGELRGNGQFVRRQALLRCGGWNEQTITDDLDLSLRLHLDHWEIACVMEPAVGEEGVTGGIALWHQRNRWAEGGYQSYLDYWRLIVQNRLGTGKTYDLCTFWLIKYFLPAAAFPDFVIAIARNRPPIWLPLTSLTIVFSLIGMVRGLNQSQQSEPGKTHPLPTIFQALWGTLYMLHWLPVVASVTARISVRAKRLKWVKTVHQGTVDGIPPV